MALTSWKGARVRKTDVTIAKNYPTADEVDTLLRVHHKRPVTNNRLVDRLATEQQYHRIAVGLQQHLRAADVQRDQIRLSGDLLAVHLHRAVQPKCWWSSPLTA